MKRLDIESVTDTQLIYLLEQRVAQELFKSSDDKNYQIARYLIDLIEVMVDSMDESDNDDE